MEKRSKRHISELSEQIICETALPHIDLDSNKSALVDGCRGIVEYNSETVRINCGTVVVRLCGCDLTIRALSQSRIYVAGRIVSVEFCNL